MTSIVDLPNEPRYTIKAVASQTGIRPVTLRAWERRHEVLNPHRSENHYRLYSERDIAILRWLKHRVDEGASIGSAVSELRRMAYTSNWPEAIPQAPGPGGGSNAVPSAQDAALLAQALMNHDENTAGKLLRDFHVRYELLAFFTEVVSPAIHQVEEAWQQERTSVAIKRFAVSYLREKLLSLLCLYPTRHASPLILIGCAPMEVNELNALMLAVLLRSSGYRVEYLGLDIAIEDLADYSSYMMPAMVILNANSEFTAHQMRRMQSMLNKVRSAPVFAYTGRAFDQDPSLRTQVQGVYLGASLAAGVETAQHVLRSRKKGSQHQHRAAVQKALA